MIWTVLRVLDRPDLPQHAEVRCAAARRTILVSSAALRDGRRFRAVRDEAGSSRHAAQPAGRRVWRAWRSLFAR